MLESIKHKSFDQLVLEDFLCIQQAIYIKDLGLKHIIYTLPGLISKEFPSFSELECKACAMILHSVFENKAALNNVNRTILRRKAEVIEITTENTL